MDINEAKLNNKYQALREERDKRIALWEEISEYVAPHMGIFDGRRPNDMNTRGRYILDNTIRHSLSTLQAGMQGGLTSPSRAWLQLTLDNPELSAHPDVMAWVGMTRDLLINIFMQSNIYKCLHGLYGELGAFGTGAIYIEDDIENVINGRLLTCGEYVAGFDTRGLPDSFGREIWMTAADMRENFGPRHLSQMAQSAIENGNENQWFKVYHMVFKDKGWGSPAKQLTRFPYASVYWQDGESTELFLGGYEEFPVVIPRWDTVGSDYWGFGIGEIALPESKMLQIMRQHYLLADELSVRPPVVLPHSAYTDRLNFNPGSVQYISDPNNVAKPLYQVQPDIPGHLQAMADSRRMIEQMFFADLFLMLASMDNGRMTATEVSVRQQEKMQMLGPVVERLEFELLNPLVARTYMIAQRRGLVPPPPDVMEGSTVKMEYISILALAQKASSIDAMNQLMALVSGLAGLDPAVIDKVNADEMVDQYVKIMAIPGSVIKSDEVVAQIREARAQQQQQAQEQQAMAAQMQMEAQQANTIKTGADAMKSGAAAAQMMNLNVGSMLGNGI